MAIGVKACVDGVSRNVKQIPVCVDLVSRNTKEGWACVDGVSRKFFGGAGLSIGQSVFMNLGGSRHEFIVVHKGLPSSVYDSSCDGIWVMIKHCYCTYKWDYGYDYLYESSDVHTYLNDNTFTRLDSFVQNLVKEVKIPHYGRIPNGDGTSSKGICNGANGLSTKIFLLSYTEVMGGTNSNAATEGAVLDYFNGASAADRIFYTSDTSTASNQWYLRTVHKTYTNNAWHITTTGEAGYNHVNTSLDLRFAFILPHDIQVDSNFNIIA